MPLSSSSAFSQDGRRMGRFAQGMLLLVAGAAQALSLAWPWARGQGDGPLSLIGGYGRPLWWLQILSLAVLARALQTAQRPAQAAGRAMLFATAWLVATFWWLFISMHVYGGLPAPLAVAAVLALAAFLGSYYAVAAWGWQRLRPAGAAGGALLFSAVWLLAELARGWLWTGFPWGAGGYAHVEGPLSVLPRWIGVYGTGAVAAWLAYGLAALLDRQGLRPVRLVAAAAALVLAWGGLWWLRDAAINAPSAERPALSVALLQGNIPQDEKFEAGSGIPLALGWYGRELRAATAQLVVAPETAVPLLPQQLPEEYLDLLREPYLKKDGRQAALLGIPLGSEEAGYTNSVVGWQPGQIQDYQYDKHHLVPFGEFIPPLFRWFTQMMNIPLGDFNRGALGQPSMAWAGERLSPNICYEDLFGEELGAHFGNAATAPTVLVNFSNIGWFGDSVAIDQHLAISRMRALEFERPMLRATNTGATVAIDHRGVVTQALVPYERAVLQASVQGREALTPFARWVHAAGLVPLCLAALAVLAVAWIRRRKRPVQGL
ncbi:MULTISPECIES: apolipoprotein N-acyltransferase [unclassified Delftia]|uniref:apolipoprotein N-acyltransferase n=1 Tax=unclassified Delftia TaxID=2613839 RepID=UPI0018FFEC15|nr:MULTISPECIES: apolipoprotein N-acyltransferase [unclassified Delftia]MBK0115716.1 apolipoprotein N-acyltransferase [Delftia sp. S65]MBK0121572.1 apolipoprotein N-acyltransferase [Delftia sp. S67]MBK0130261.1 apolipoprotein N-acyltransferase [Delftia sp. S66]